MQQMRIQMGMPVTVTVADRGATLSDLTAVFDWFEEVDKRFSPFKTDSEVSKLNRGDLDRNRLSPEFREILDLAHETTRATNGYFSIVRGDLIDPSGLVKGWAIQRATEILKARDRKNFLIDVGGDIAISGQPRSERKWQVGIRHPFQTSQIVKRLNLINCGVATSGTYERGRHIFNPKTQAPASDRVVSLTVVGPTIYEADRFATAAFAMGEAGLEFLEHQPALEAYLIRSDGQAAWTSGFSRYWV